MKTDPESSSPLISQLSCEASNILNTIHPPPTLCSIFLWYILILSLVLFSIFHMFDTRFPHHHSVNIPSFRHKSPNTTPFLSWRYEQLCVTRRNYTYLVAQYPKLLNCFFLLGMYKSLYVFRTSTGYTTAYYNAFQEDRVQNRSSLDVSAKKRPSLDKATQQDTTKVTDVTFWRSFK